MRYLTCLFLVLSACAKKADTPITASSTAQSLESLCQSPAAVTHDFINGPLQNATEYDCPGLYSKMSCHYFAGVLGDKELACTDITAGIQQGAPTGFVGYSNGTRLFLDGTLGQAAAYDGGLLYGGLRCFYFVGVSGTIDEDILCQD